MNNREQCRKEKLSKTRLGIKTHLNTDKANLVNSSIVFNTLSLVASDFFYTYFSYNSNITMGKVYYNVYVSNRAYKSYKKTALTPKQKKNRKANQLKKQSRKLNKK